MLQTGPHSVTAFNRGLCFYTMGQYDKALLSVNRALELRPGYRLAQTYRDRILAECTPEVGDRGQVTKVTMRGGVTLMMDPSSL